MSGGRSPAYPYVDLRKAVELTGEIYSIAKRHSVNKEVLFKQLGFTSMSGSAKKTLAALKYYGLLEQSHGDSDVRLSDRAIVIVHALDGSAEKRNAIRDAFFSPAMYAYCFEKWGSDYIPDDFMKSHLILDKGFNDSTVSRFITQYKVSLAFAERHGAVEGMEDGIETDNESAHEQELEPGREQEQQEDRQQARNQEAPRGEAAQPGERVETFTLSESEVSIRFPASMTPDDYEFFVSWLDLLKKKIGRRVARENPGSSGSD